MEATQFMSQGDSIRLENQLCFALYACSREITKLYRPILEELDLTYTQYITMLSLWEQDHVTIKEIGARLYLDSGTLTPLLKKLEAMGLLLRIRDKHDERNVLIKLTEKGSLLKVKVMDIPEKLFHQIGMPAEAVASLRAQIFDLLQKVQSASKEAPKLDRGQAAAQ